MPRRALITGITGQDGAYLARLLLDQGYEIHGNIRQETAESSERLDEIRERIQLHQVDLLDQAALRAWLERAQPEEVYNLAAPSYVPASFEQPLSTSEFTLLGVTRMLESIRQVNARVRFYQASSSEMFGETFQEPQNELTPFRPRSPYGVAKLFGHWITVNYRETYGQFACSGILFNHESPLRGREFVTRKITYAVARIKHGLQDKLLLGNLEAKRDWGYAGDYVRAMWLMLQQPVADDYVVATGIKHSVREFCELAFRYADLDWQDYVTADPTLIRSTDVHTLRGDASKARSILGWQPTVTFPKLVKRMVDADLEFVSKQKSR